MRSATAAATALDSPSICWARPTSGDRACRGRATPPDAAHEPAPASVADSTSHEVPHEPERRLVDQDLAGAGRLLQALRGVHRMPARRGTAGSGPLCDHLARADPDTGAEPNAEAPRSSSSRELRQRLPELHRRPHRAQGIVVVEGGHAEHGHERVARVCLDRAAVSLEHRPHVLEVTRADPAARLGVGSLRRRREPRSRRRTGLSPSCGSRAPAVRSHRSRPPLCATRRPARAATGRAAPDCRGRSARCPGAGDRERSPWWPVTAASPPPGECPSLAARFSAGPK